MSLPKLYVITRTASRPNLYRKCRDSVDLLSSLFRVDHIAICDSPETDYVDADRSTILRVDRVEKRDGGHFPYNLYINVAHGYISRCEPGWVMYLDDDDFILPELERGLREKFVDRADTLYMWRTEFPDGRILPRDKYWGKCINRNNVPSSSFMFHSSILRGHTYSWTDRRGGDFRMLEKLFSNVERKVWVDVVGTKVYSEGWGERKDSVII
jgi:hypothetical protein